jgi:hypothetical protein
MGCQGAEREYQEDGYGIYCGQQMGELRDAESSDRGC